MLRIKAGMEAGCLVAYIEEPLFFGWVILGVEIYGLFTKDCMDISFQYGGVGVLGQINGVSEAPRLRNGNLSQFIQLSVPVGYVGKGEQVGCQCDHMSSLQFLMA